MPIPHRMVLRDIRSFRAGRRGLALLAALLLMLGLLMERSRERLDHQRQAQTALATLASGVHELHSVEWAASVGQRRGDEAETMVGPIVGRLQDTMRRLEVLGVSATQRRALEEGLAATTRPLRRQLALLRAGRAAAARRLDEAQTDPAFARLERIAARAVHREERAAAGAATASDRTYVALLLAGGLLVAALTLRLLRMTRQMAAGEQERRLASLLRHSTDVPVIVGTDGLIDYVAPSIRHVLGRPSAALVGRRVVDLAVPEDREVAGKLLTQRTAAAGSEAVASWRVHHGDGSTRRIEVRASNRIDDPAVEGWLLNVRDVTERHALETELRHRAFHDDLTGLANRALLLECLERSLAARRSAGESCALLFIDLDAFKDVNDRNGHAAGDALLRETARRLQEVARSGDLVARFGGDEFAMILDRVAGPDDALAVSERVVETLGRSMVVGHEELTISVSIGVAVADAGGLDAETLVRQADVAMYAAKQRNVDVELYQAEDEPDAEGRFALLGKLRSALAEGEIGCAFQPKVDVRTGRAVGMEALVRWQHPERGLLPPARFLPLAEKTGQMAQITARVLELALAAVAERRREDPDFTVAVNLPATALRDGALPGHVARALAAAAVPGEALQLEITESMLLGEAARTEDVIAGLRALGCTLAIDDFGTGYSSLTRLKALPLAELKIDRSFVCNLTSDADDAAIVRGTINLAHDLGLAVTAEGVEDEGALGQLRALGCDMAQGFHLARPMPAAELGPWLRRWHARHLGRVACANGGGRKRSDVALAETQAWFPHLFEAESRPAALTAVDGTYLRVNRAMCTLLGRGEAELMQLRFPDVTHPDDRTLDVEAIDDLLMGRAGTVTLDKRYVRGDGRIVHAQTDVSMVRDDAGRPLHFFVQTRDVTRARLADEELRGLYEVHRVVLSAAGDGIYGIDSEGRATFVNPAAGHLLGFSPEELLGCSMHASIHHHRADGSAFAHVDCPIYAALTDGVVHRVERDVFWRRDGTPLPVRYTSTPILRQDSPAGAVVVFSPLGRGRATAAPGGRRRRAVAAGRA